MTREVASLVSSLLGDCRVCPPGASDDELLVLRGLGALLELLKALLLKCDIV